MKKINVVGTSGSGKSTVSKLLAQKLNYPYIEMDAVYWKADWQEPSDEEFFLKLAQSLQQPNWVLDGNYNRSVPVKWAEVDTVIWVDYSFSRTIYQAVTRAIKRCLSGQELWQGTGNVETFKQSFFSKDSVLLWTLQTYKKNRRRYLQVMNNPEFSHIHFVRLTSPKKVQAFINSLDS